MSYEDYPLPDAAQFFGNSDQLIDPTRRTTMGKGYVKTRAGAFRDTKVFDFDTELTPTEKITFEKFLKARKVGSVPFYWRNRDESYGDNTWQANHVYTADDIIHPVTPNGHSYICTVGGTSGATAPTFPATKNATVTDGETPTTVTWKENTYLVRVREGGVKFTRINHQKFKASVPLEEM